LVAAVVPDGVDDAAGRKLLLQRHDTEISGGLGEQAGKLWRIGLMGHNSTPRNVLFVLSALEDVLLTQGYEVPVGASLAAAQRVLRDGYQAAN
jgi:alanine-glyoxylate transaminase/serine-glyoxylate transaminase/serine-pyruvate transaminase